MADNLKEVTKAVIKTSKCLIIPVYDSKSRLVVHHKKRTPSDKIKKCTLTVLSNEAERLRSVFQYCLEVGLLPLFYSFLGNGEAPVSGGDGTSRGLNIDGSEVRAKQFSDLESCAKLFWLAHESTPRLIGNKPGPKIKRKNLKKLGGGAVQVVAEEEDEDDDDDEGNSRKRKGMDNDVVAFVELGAVSMLRS